MCTAYLSSLFRIICLSEFRLPRLAMLLTSTFLMISVRSICGCFCQEYWILPSFSLKQDVRLCPCKIPSISYASQCNLAYFYVSHKVFFVNNLMPSAFVLIQVLGWSIFLILLPVAVLRIARICEGENRLWRQPGRATYMQDNNDFKIDRVILGSLSPRNKLFE